MHAARHHVDEGHQGLSADAETGLIYNRHRYLHVTLGRFTSPDPHPQGRYVDGMNGYEYVRSGPANWIDPFGLELNHDFPRKVFERPVLEKIGLPDFDIHAPGNLSEMDYSDHRGRTGIHRGNSPQNPGGEYNRAWRNWLTERMKDPTPITEAELQQQRQVFRTEDPRFSEQFGRSKPSTRRYPGAPVPNKKALGVLGGIAALIAAGQAAEAAMGEFADPNSPCGVWLRRAISNGVDPSNINSNDNCALQNCRERLKQLARDGSIQGGVSEVAVDAMMDELANYAREAAIGRQSIGNQPAY